MSAFAYHHSSVLQLFLNEFVSLQPEPEFRPPMSEVVQALVRLVQRAGMAQRRPSDESSFGHKTSDYEAIDMLF